MNKYDKLSAEVATRCGECVHEWRNVSGTHVSVDDQLCIKCKERTSSEQEMLPAFKPYATDPKLILDMMLDFLEPSGYFGINLDKDEQKVHVFVMKNMKRCSECCRYREEYGSYVEYFKDHDSPSIATAYVLARAFLEVERNENG